MELWSLRAVWGPAGSSLGDKTPGCAGSGMRWTPGCVVPCRTPHGHRAQTQPVPPLFSTDSTAVFCQRVCRCVPKKNEHALPTLYPERGKAGTAGTAHHGLPLSVVLAASLTHLKSSCSLKLRRFAGWRRPEEGAISTLQTYRLIWVLMEYCPAGLTQRGGSRDGSEVPSRHPAISNPKGDESHSTEPIALPTPLMG